MIETIDELTLCIRNGNETDKQFNYEESDKFIYCNLRSKERGGMKFDVVMGNPPYQDNNKSTYTQLWTKFVVLGYNNLTDNGNIMYVTPMTWITSKSEKRISETGEIRSLLNSATYINLSDKISKQFANIGSSFSYYVIPKISHGEKTIIDTGTEKFVVDMRKTKKIPKDVNALSFSIFKKMTQKGFFPKSKSSGVVGELISTEDKKNDKMNDYPFPVLYSMSTVKWSNRKHPQQDLIKLVFPNQNAKNYPYLDNGVMAPANRGAVYIVNSLPEGQKFLDYIKSSAVQYYISQQRFHHGLLNTEVISNIPLYDLNAELDSESIYKYFGFTNSEVSKIETGK